MTLAQIYSQFTRGSQGFCKAVETYCGFGISLDETKRIAEKAETAEDFQRIWEFEDWWTDEKAAA
jgi:hypothetical protein